MREISYQEIATQAVQQLSAGGGFLTVGDMASANTMVIGWGGALSFWGGGVFLAPVRKSRYTWELLQKAKEFTVSIPLHDMSAALRLCGTKSGRDMDKFAAAGLTRAKAAAGDTPVVGECELHIVCRLLGGMPMNEAAFDKEVLDRWYGDQDMHTFFFGRIVKAYYS